MASGTLVDRYTGVDRYAVCDSICHMAALACATQAGVWFWLAGKLRARGPQLEL